MANPEAYLFLLRPVSITLVSLLILLLVALVRLAAHVRSDHRKLMDLLTGATRAQLGPESDQMNKRVRGLSLLCLLALAMTPLTLTFITLNSARPEKNPLPAPESEISTQDLNNLDDLTPPTGIPVDQVHDFYRSRLQQIRDIHSGLVKKLTEVNLKNHTLTNQVAQLEQDLLLMKDSYLEMERIEAALNEELAQSSAVQGQLVDELAKSQEIIQSLSAEVQAAKGLLTDTLIDIEVALEKAGPSLDDLDANRLRDADAILQEAGGIRKRLEDVTQELFRMRSRLRPNPVELLELEDQIQGPIE